MVTDAEGVSFHNDLSLDALTLVLHAIGRTHVHDEVLAIDELDHGVLTRHIGIFDGQIARLLAAPNNEAVFRDREALPLVVNGERAG